MPSLVGSEMCIRDRNRASHDPNFCELQNGGSRLIGELCQAAPARPLRAALAGAGFLGPWIAAEPAEIVLRGLAQNRSCPAVSLAKAVGEGAGSPVSGSRGLDSGGQGPSHHEAAQQGRRWPRPDHPPRWRLPERGLVLRFQSFAQPGRDRAQGCLRVPHSHQSRRWRAIDHQPAAHDDHGGADEVSRFLRWLAPMAWHQARLTNDVLAAASARVISCL